MSEWKRVKLGGVGKIITGKTPRTAEESYWESGDIMFLTPSDDLRGKYIYNTKRYVTQAGADSVNCLLPRKAICVTSIGSDLGKVVINTSECITNQQINSIIPNKNTNLDFLFYSLKIIGGKMKYISKTSTAVPIVNKTQFSNYELFLPLLEEQQAIADVLSCLDDKIELNNKINKNLEEQAQALFKHWFVDFEFPDKDGNPYKSSGGEMNDSELGLIPKDWEVKMFEELFDFLEGPGIRNWQYVQKGKGVKFMNIRCIQNNDIGITSANMISEEEAYGKYKHFLLQAGDVVVSTSGTLGRWAIVREEHLPLCLNTSIIRFQARNKTWTSFMTMYLSSKDFINHLETKASGSVQKNFGPMHLRQIEVIAPTQKLVEKLDKVLNIIICKLLDIKTENQKLAELRDYLLPKLMSGEIRVKQ